jgi:tetratricopeptide (TPR) repeat protein
MGKGTSQTTLKPALFIDEKMFLRQVGESGSMAPQNDIPKAEDVRRQLRLILESASLVRSGRRSKLLHYLVEKALAHEEVTEMTIISDLFPEYEELNVEKETSIVRTHVAHLRERLSDYYALGKEIDEVLIELPKGAYKAKFSLNPRSKAVRHYRRGLFVLRSFSLTDLLIACCEFERAIEADPTNAFAHAAWADADLRSYFIVELFVFGGFGRWQNLDIENRTSHAWNLNPKCWYACLMLGAAHFCSMRWKEAEKSFAEALRLDADETQSHIWYQAFLVTTGRAEQALYIARRRANRIPEDLLAQLALGLMLHVTDKFSEAQQVLDSAQLLDQKHWGTDLLIGLNHLAMGETNKALSSFNRIDSRTSDPTWPALSGLVSLCYAQNGEIERALQLMAELKSRHRVAPDQLALAHMALGEPAEAIEALKGLFERRSAWGFWIHLWPMFEPLRKHEGFKQLIHRMNLPSLPKRKRRRTTRH